MRNEYLEVRDGKAEKSVFQCEVHTFNLLSCRGWFKLWTFGFTLRASLVFLYLNAKGLKANPATVPLILLVEAT